jgi:hypothetical protein
MITLAHHCLVFEMPGGESVPFSPEMVCAQVTGGATELFDPEFIEEAINGVFHYFKHELGRQSLALGEFQEALDKVLRGFAVTAQLSAPSVSDSHVLEYDLCRLALESGQGRELLFFPRLRSELQRHLRQAPRVLRFRGLRGCVKHLAGARRWSLRCQSLEGEIVAYLRECLRAESAPLDIALLVE